MVRSLAHAGGQNLARRNVGGIENCHIQMNSTNTRIYRPRPTPSYDTDILSSLFVLRAAHFIAVVAVAAPWNDAVESVECCSIRLRNVVDSVGIDRPWHNKALQLVLSKTVKANVGCSRQVTSTTTNSAALRTFFIVVWLDLCLLKTARILEIPVSLVLTMTPESEQKKTKIYN
jgi:hypothetical protein